MTQRIALMNAAWQVVRQVFVEDGCTAAQAGDNAFGNLTEVPVARFGDLTTERIDRATLKWTTDLEKLRTILLSRIDDDREANRGLVMTQLLGQSFVYAEKAREVGDYRFTIGNLLTALTMPQRRARFPFAMAEADATGDTLAAVIDRFEAGAVASRTEVARIDGIAVKAKRAIRAATTEAAIRDAAAINWKKER